MGKTVTLRVSQSAYEMFRVMAERENRPLSNFIETAALRYMEEHLTLDEYERAEIVGNQELSASLRQGHEDARARRGRFV
ncbi:MAG: CopG family transcriptional regulator [Candidatus Latescibacterota bacterium]|jgi:uncharacterized protein (DUF1778 family)